MSLDGLGPIFRDEVVPHVVRLAGASVTALERGDLAESPRDELRRAVHSVAGAARLVGLDRTSRICHLLEGWFKDQRPWRPNQAAVFVTVVTRLEELAAAGDDALEIWEHTHGAILDELLASGAAATAEPVATPARAPRPLTAPPPSAPPRRKVAPATPAPVAEQQNLDLGLAELLKAELETHAATLTEGLLLLEQDPTRTEQVDALMRAAHSIKGAVRIVGLTSAVGLAHVMEEVLRLWLADRLPIGAGAVEPLLRATDVFVTVGGKPVEAMGAWTAAELAEIASATTALERAITATAASVEDAEAPEVPEVDEAFPTTAETGPRTATTASTTTATAVKVSSETVDRLVALAGEVAVESGRLATVTRAAPRLTTGLQQVASALEALATAAAEPGADPTGALGRGTTELQHRLRALRSGLRTHVSELEAFARRGDELAQRLSSQAIRTRMRPFQDGTHGLPRMARDLARTLGKQAQLVVRGNDVGVDREVLAKIESALGHLLRNALDHGIEAPAERVAAGKSAMGTLTIEAKHWAGMLAIVVSDDGRGIDPEMVRSRVAARGLVSDGDLVVKDDAAVLDLLFLPGFSTRDEITDVSGRGVGLDVVRSVTQEVGGTVRLSSRVGVGSAFQMQLPITLAVTRTIVVEIGGEPMALPLTRVEKVVTFADDRIETLEGRCFVTMDGRRLGLVDGAVALGFPPVPRAPGERVAVVIGEHANACGVMIDRYLGEQALAARPLDPRLGKVGDVSAVSTLADGSPILILDADDLHRSIVAALAAGQVGALTAGAARPRVRRRRRVLIVDDSITVREVERQLLMARGYDVAVAVDGVDGWQQLQRGAFDLVITDVDMPRMNGLDLVRSIKQDQRYGNTPTMIVSYRDREGDRLAGLAVGADHYLTKSSFHDDALVGAVQLLIGEAEHDTA